MVQSQVRFNRVPTKKVPEKVPGGFNAEPSQKVWEALGAKPTYDRGAV